MHGVFTSLSNGRVQPSLPPPKASLPASPPRPQAAQRNCTTLRSRLRQVRRRYAWMRKLIGSGVGIGCGSGAIPFDPLHLVAYAGWPLPFLNFAGARHKPKRKKRILIIYANTGGGHRASAEALRSGFQQSYRDRYEVDVVDLWSQHAPYPVSKLPNSYSFLVRHPWMYWLLYHFLNPRWIHQPYFAILRLVCYHRVNEAFELYKPDLVVSVHPLLQHIPIKILQDRIRAGVQRPIAFTTVITDYTTCHNSWFHTGVTQCFVPTEYCYKLGRRLGLRSDQLTLHGLPIRPEFAKPLPPRATLRKKLDMLADVPAVLLVGGGEGMGSLEEIVIAIEKTVGAAAQVVVICGRNKALAQRLQERTYPAGMHVLVHGFVHNMNEWMSACDAVVTKAGPGTIAEALISGTPILLNGHIPGQEAGNIPFVTENKVGSYERNPVKIAEILNEWFVSKQDELKEMSLKAKSLGRPDALNRIVQDLAALCEQPIFSPSLAGHAQAMLA